MTLKGWKEQTDPKPLLRYLGSKATARQLQLFGCACARRVWHLIDNEEHRKVVETVQQQADGLVSADTVRTVAQKTYGCRIRRDASHTHAAYRSGLDACAAAYNCAWPYTWTPQQAEVIAESAASAMAWEAASFVPPWELQSEVWHQAHMRARQAQADLVREIFFPFRKTKVEPYLLQWNHGAIPAMAQAIYREKRFEEVAVLGDALQDAGCRNDLILEHCCQEKSHSAGCWVLDLLRL